MGLARGRGRQGRRRPCSRRPAAPGARRAGAQHDVEAGLRARTPPETPRASAPGRRPPSSHRADASPEALKSAVASRPLRALGGPQPIAHQNMPPQSPTEGNSAGASGSPPATPNRSNRWRAPALPPRPHRSQERRGRPGACAPRLHHLDGAAPAARRASVWRQQGRQTLQAAPHLMPIPTSSAPQPAAGSSNLQAGYRIEGQRFFWRQCRWVVTIQPLQQCRGIVRPAQLPGQARAAPRASGAPPLGYSRPHRGAGRRAGARRWPPASRPSAVRGRCRRRPHPGTPRRIDERGERFSGRPGDAGRLSSSPRRSASPGLLEEPGEEQDRRVAASAAGGRDGSPVPRQRGPRSGAIEGSEEGWFRHEDCDAPMAGARIRRAEDIRAPANTAP